jgi:hypothetical protein
MAKTRCPKCGYTEDDGRAHDRAVYLETCTHCLFPPARDDHSASRRVDVLEREAPHLLADPVLPMPSPLEAHDHA